MKYLSRAHIDLSIKNQILIKISLQKIRSELINYCVNSELQHRVDKAFILSVYPFDLCCVRALEVKRTVSALSYFTYVIGVLYWQWVYFIWLRNYYGIWEIFVLICLCCLIICLIIEIRTGLGLTAEIELVELASWSTFVGTPSWIITRFLWTVIHSRLSLCLEILFWNFLICSCLLVHRASLDFYERNTGSLSTMIIVE